MRASRPAPALAVGVKVESSDAWVGGWRHGGRVEAALASEGLVRLDREQGSGHDDGRYICDSFIFGASLIDLRINVMELTTERHTGHESRIQDRRR
jgi:hypothetical protein